MDWNTEELSPDDIGSQIATESAKSREELKNQINDAHKEAEDSQTKSQTHTTDFPHYEAWLRSQNKLNNDNNGAEIITAILLLGSVGAIMQAGVFAFSWWKRGGLKRFKPLPIHAEIVCHRTCYVFQGLWLFYALIKTSEVSQSILELDTFIIFLCLSLPVLTLHILEWIVERSVFSVWVIFLSVILQAILVSLVEYWGYEYINFVMSIIAVFIIFYITNNFYTFWNRFTSSNINK